jgi:hypothetical protein
MTPLTNIGASLRSPTAFPRASRLSRLFISASEDRLSGTGNGVGPARGVK